MPDSATSAQRPDRSRHPRDGFGGNAGRWWHPLASDRLTITLVLWIGVALIYWPSAAALDAIWRGSAGDTYTHGYLVLTASLWLIARDRARLKSAPLSPVPWAWTLLALLSVGWLWSWRAEIQALHVLLLPVILLVALVATLGWRVAGVSLFPVVLLVFAMPVWGVLNDGLQTFSAKANGILIWLSGMPAYMQGDLIRLPGGSIAIAQTCSGLNAFVIGLTLAALYGEIARHSLRRRLAWLGLMGAFALIANSVRIFIVTAAAYQTDMRSPLVEHHIWLGWCLFAIAVVVFLVIAGRLADAWDRVRPREARAAKRPSGGIRQPIDQGLSVARLAVVLACMGLLPAVSYGTDLLRSKTDGAIAIHWPEAPPGWRGPMPDAVSEWSPRFVNPSAESLRLYIDSRSEPIEAFAVGYQSQTQDAKLLGFGNSLLGSATRLQAQSQQIVDSPTGRWRETVAVDPSGMLSVIWWRYRVGERTFIQPRLSQFWYGLVALTGRPPVSSLVALRAICRADCGAVREQLSVAAAQLQPAL